MSTQYKLKADIDALRKPGAKVEAEVEGVDEAKVLLVNVKGEIKAISHKYYGAPLVKGVLTQDGRITCPWHGACFSVRTGDIEDAPALDPLHSFPCVHKDGAIYITADETALKAGRRKPKSTASVGVSQDDHVVVVGGGAGGLGTIEGLREGGFKGKITVLSKENHPPIDRTRLSKGLATDVSKLAARTAEFLSDNLQVDFHPGTTVTRLDSSKRIITTSDGTTYNYTAAILATGGTPRQLPLPGFKELKNIFVLRTVDNTKQIVEATGEEKKKVVVVGSSFIGLEVANALAKKHDITVIGMEAAPLERVIGVEVGQKVQRLLEKNGIKFRLNASVDSAVPDANDSSKVGGVKLKSGETLAAEVVILGVGVAPETTYLKESGWNLEQDGSVLVDKNFAVVGHEHLYAVGDIARYPYPFIKDHPVRIEHWNVALNSGRAVGRLVAGANKNNVPVEFIPVFWSAIGVQIRYCGHPAEGFDEVIVNGSDDAKFVAYYAKGDSIVAVATVGSDPVMVKSAELLRAYKFPSTSEVKKGIDVLELPL